MKTRRDLLCLLSVGLLGIAPSAAAVTEAECVVTEEYIENGSKAEYLNVFTYDRDGRRLSQETINVEDGGIVEGYTTYTYDDDGNRLSETDFGWDGLASRMVSYTYDDDGHRLSEVYDYDYDGEEDRRVSYIWDDDGHLLRMLEKYDEKELHTYSYDRKGNLIVEEHDTDANGSVETRIYYTYDRHGNLILEEWYDRGGEQSDCGCATSSGPATGSLVFLLLFALACRGDFVDRVVRYSYDGDGNLVTVEYDADGDGELEERKTLVYDRDGNLIREKWDYLDRKNMDSGGPDEGTDGKADYRVEYGYDDHGRLILEERYGPYDDVPGTRYTWTYEGCNGVDLCQFGYFHGDCE